MLLYRISKSIYARDREGLGSKLYGGRYNNIGIPCIYTSESRALAILEYAVNIELKMIPTTMAITIYEVTTPEFFEINIEDLPADWRNNPAPVSAKEFGSRFLQNKNYLGIRLPSAIVPQEYNYVINPLSVKAAELEVLDVEDFVFDQCINL